MAKMRSVVVLPAPFEPMNPNKSPLLTVKSRPESAAMLPYIRVKPNVCTAGMGLRASAWEALVRQGFRPHLTGRIGQRLLAGWDTELCYALKLAGWKLVIDHRLKVQHYLPTDRLSWKYLRTLVAGSAYSVPALDAYHFAWRKGDSLRETWLWAFASGVKQLLMRHRLRKILTSRLRRREGNDEVILIDMQIARLKGLLSLRGRYGYICHETREAAWRKRDRLL